MPKRVYSELKWYHTCNANATANISLLSALTLACNISIKLANGHGADGTKNYLVFFLLPPSGSTQAYTAIGSPYLFLRWLSLMSLKVNNVVPQMAFQKALNVLMAS